MVYPRIHDPILYETDLDDTHDRYDYPRARPSAGKLHVEFSILASINAVTATLVFLLMTAMLRSKKVRSNVFNIYLLAIAFPDFMVSLLCFFTCALSAPQSEFFSEWMCGFQSFYLNWAFIANAWLNGVVVFQIHKMLRHSQVRRRYIPPTRTQVMTHVALVYTYASVWGFLCGFNIDFLPHSSHLYYGFACMPMEYNRASTLFFWLAYLPLSLGLPLVFAAYAATNIITKGLLPPTGKRRVLSMFLLRLCFLYFAIWLPFLVLFLVGNFVVINQLVFWTGAAISHLQGLFSVLFCLTNKDIQKSFVNILTCRTDYDDQADSSDLRSNSWTRRTTHRQDSASALLRLKAWVLPPSQENRSSSLQKPSEDSVEVLEAQIKNWNGRYENKEQLPVKEEQEEEDENNNGIGDGDTDQEHAVPEALAVDKD